MICTLRVTATDPDMTRVAVRRQQFSVGRPVEFDGDSERIAALEYALGAVAGEVVGGLRMFASRRRLPIDQVEAVITGVVEHELALLEVVGEDGEPTIAGIHLKVFITTRDEPGVRRLWTDLMDRLPLLCTMKRAVPIHVELQMTS